MDSKATNKGSLTHSLTDLQQRLGDLRSRLGELLDPILTTAEIQSAPSPPAPIASTTIAGLVEELHLEVDKLNMLVNRIKL